MEQIIFVSFINGAGGHRFSRVLSSLKDIHWYSSKENGKQPWNISNPITNTRVASKYHFETPFNYIRNNEDILKMRNIEYNNDELWEKFHKEIKNNIVIPTHRMPDELHSRYPNSKIFNIIKDIDVCARRCVDIVGEWELRDMAHAKNVFVSPADKNSYRKYKDLWALKNFNSYYQVWHKKTFTEFFKTMIQDNHNEKVVSNVGLKVDMDKKINWKKVKEYLYE